MPSPRAVVQGLVAVVATREVWVHAGASLYRIAIGFGGALLVAVLMGLASFLWRSARIEVADVVTVPHVHPLERVDILSTPLDFCRVRAPWRVLGQASSARTPRVSFSQVPWSFSLSSPQQDRIWHRFASTTASFEEPGERRGNVASTSTSR